MNRPCKHHGCPAVVARGVGYCPAHAAQGEQRRAEAVRQYDATRDPWAVEFYRSRGWLRMRRTVLTEQPVCAECRRAFAAHVDHRVPLLDDWARRLDRDNLQGLCQRCHASKTARERSRGPATAPTGDDRAANGQAVAPTPRTPQTGLRTPRSPPAFLG